VPRLTLEILLTAKLLLALASTVILTVPTGLMIIFYCLTALGAFRLFRDYRKRKKEIEETLHLGLGARKYISGFEGSQAVPLGASTFHNPMGLHGLLQGYLYLFFLPQRKNNFSATKTNRLMLFRETDCVYCGYI
jgi:hypothetical protein